MFPVSGVESAFLPVTDNETGNFYQNAWHYHYHNQLQSPYAMFGNVPGTSGLFVNNNLWPPAHEHQVVLFVLFFLFLFYLNRGIDSSVGRTSDS